MKINIFKTINKLKGHYQFISPYHKNRKMLPFNITGYSYDTDFPVQVQTVEYRGWEKSIINSGYTMESILEKIKSGFLIKIKQ